ncbi:MAG: 3-hydroxyacyl-CoA dehydrogenase NAD-binding domain-containing protein [Paracoccaceae bacterium]
MRLNDIDEAALGAARDTIRHNLDREISRGKIAPAERDDALARISTTLTLADRLPPTLIIEAATEDERVKEKIFASLPRLKPETILASNTSSISITHASRTDRPEKFIGSTS